MISAALAGPPLTMTTMGRRGHCCGLVSLNSCDEPGARPRVSTIALPGSRNKSETATPWSSSPPGLPRRSKMSDFIPCFSRVSIAWLTSRSEEHTSELQSLAYLVCRLLLEKKKRSHEGLIADQHPTPD